MSKLDQLIEEIKRQRQFAADTLEDAIPQTINARRSRKRNAQMRLQDLFSEYRQAVRSQVFAIVVIGSEADEFEKIASSIAKLQGLDADAFYEELISRIDERLFAQKEQNAYLIDVASRHLEDIAFDIGVISYPRIIYNQKYDGRTSTQQEAFKLIKRVIEEQVGAEMAAIFLIDHAVRRAYEHDIDTKVHPLLIKVKDDGQSLPTLLSSLKTLGNKSIVVSAGKSSVDAEMKLDVVNEKTVLDTLKKIKKKLK
jgi:hypothetical protein